jgi:hypothetical protein
MRISYITFYENRNILKNKLLILSLVILILRCAVIAVSVFATIEIIELEYSCCRIVRIEYNDTVKIEYKSKLEIIKIS